MSVHKHHCRSGRCLDTGPGSEAAPTEDQSRVELVQLERVAKDYVAMEMLEAHLNLSW